MSISATRFKAVSAVINTFSEVRSFLYRRRTKRSMPLSKVPTTTLTTRIEPKNFNSMQLSGGIASLMLGSFEDDIVKNISPTICKIEIFFFIFYFCILF